MNKSFRYLMEHKIGRKQERRENAAQLAPLEEKTAVTAGLVQETGALIVNSEGRGVSDDIAEGRYGKKFIGMEPVVIVILVFMFCFIAFIAWQISLMPAE